MSQSLRRLAPLAILAGSLGAVLTLAAPGEAQVPGVRGSSVPRGPSMPSQSQSWRAPQPSTLSRQRGKTSGSPSQSGPTTFGYWDGSRFVRTPGPWNVPDNGFKATPDQRPR